MKKVVSIFLLAFSVLSIDISHAISLKDFAGSYVLADDCELEPFRIVFDVNLGYGHFKINGQEFNLHSDNFKKFTHTYDVNKFLEAMYIFRFEGDTLVQTIKSRLATGKLDDQIITYTKKRNKLIRTHDGLECKYSME